MNPTAYVYYLASFFFYVAKDGDVLNCSRMLHSALNALTIAAKPGSNLNSLNYYSLPH